MPQLGTHILGIDMISWLILGLLALFHSGSSTAQVITLEDEDVSELPLCQAEEVLTCQKAQVSISGLLSHDNITFPNGATMSKIFTTTDAEGTVAFELKADGEASYAMGTVTQDDVAAITLDMANGQDFGLIECGSDCYLWREINESYFQFPDPYNMTANSAHLDRAVPKPQLEMLTAESRQSNAQVTITIKIYITPALSNTGANLRSMIASKIAETNAIFQNSRIPITVRAICPEMMDIAESGNSASFLDSAIRSQSTLAALYDNADVALVLSDTCRPDACGQVATINVVNPTLNTYNVPLRLGWSTIRQFPRFAFAHELGHLLGGWHDRQQLQNWCSNCPNDHYGWLVRNTRFHTVMAYGRAGNPEALPFFSTPTLLLNNQYPLGSNQDNNRRTFLSTALPVSNLGNDACQRTCINLDSLANCNFWQCQGFCTQTYAAYMRVNCADTCGYC